MAPGMLIMDPRVKNSEMLAEDATEAFQERKKRLKAESFRKVSV